MLIGVNMYMLVFICTCNTNGCLLTLPCVGGPEGYCNRFVCLSVCLSAKVQRTYEHWHFENTTKSNKDQT